MSVDPAVSLAERIAQVQATIAATCQRANRPIESVTLIAVSKTHPAETVLEAIRCGLVHFGENRIEEAAPKIAQVQAASSAPLHWHMIGHVQSRKAEDVVRACQTIHSLDSLKLAERYSRFATAQQKTSTVLLEVNVSGEESKSGFDAVEWQTRSATRELLWNAVRHMLQLSGVQIGGLMTMAPIVDDPEQARPVFVKLRTLRDALAHDFPQVGWETLSMGMTDDYVVAIEEGATMVRVGRAIFGARLK